MQNRLPVTFILITLVIDAMGIGLIMPVMPRLIEEVQGVGLSDAAIWGGLLSFAFAVMQFLFGPIIGALSDRFGRRIVLLLSLFAMAIDYVLLAVAGSIWLLFLGRIIGGITAATQSTASAFMADISAPEDKARNFGLVSAAFGLGFVIGPMIGGLLSTFGPRAPFVAAAILAALNFLLGYFVLTETVTDRTRRAFEWRRANPFGALMSISKLPGLRGLLVVLLLYQIAFYVYPSVWPYFSSYRFGWSPVMVGYSLAMFGLSMAVAQGLIVGRCVARFGERGTAAIAFGIGVLALILISVIQIGWWVMAMIPLSALGAMALPALQGIMSRIADDTQQGELQGVLSSISAVAVIISPVLMTQVFAYFTDPARSTPHGGAPFLLSAILMACAALVFSGNFRRVIPAKV